MKYSRKAETPHKSTQAKGANLRCHFKNTRETCQALRGLSLIRAKTYLKNVIAHKEAIPFRRFAGGVGRSAQTNTAFGCPRGRWPVKSCKYILDLLRNAESNAALKGLSTEKLHIKHIQANMAVKGRRRTYRAHGRINAYMSTPSNIEVILEEKEGAAVPKAQEEVSVKKVSKKKQRQERLRAGPAQE